MAKLKAPDPPAEIPSWIMTFSDVITLLMTFFILLLTFATNEPEMLQLMQVSMFSGGGALGIASRMDSVNDKNSLLVRERPRSARLTLRGSEMPPINSDATTESLAEGIAGLEDEEQRELSTNHSVTIPLALLFSSDGELSSPGKLSARMLARQMRGQPLDVVLLVGDKSELPKAQHLASHLFEEQSIQPGRIGVGLDNGTNVDPGKLRLVLTRPLEGQHNGT